MLRSILALGALAAAAGCGVETGTLPISPAEPGASVAAAGSDVELVPAEPDAEGGAGATLVASAPDPYVAVDADPERLIGLSVGEAAKLLGRPALVRREPPAEVWQYAGSECVLHLFLYESEGGPSVTHFEMRGLNGISRHDCLAAHLQAPGASGG